MLRIRSDQIEVFSDIQLTRFVERVLAETEDIRVIREPAPPLENPTGMSGSALAPDGDAPYESPARFLEKNRAARETLIREAVMRAADYGLTKESAVSVFIHFTLRRAPAMHPDSWPDRFSVVIGDPEVPEEKKVDLLAAELTFGRVP